MPNMLPGFWKLGGQDGWGGGGAVMMSGGVSGRPRGLLLHDDS